MVTHRTRNIFRLNDTICLQFPGHANPHTHTHTITTIIKNSFRSRVRKTPATKRCACVVKPTPSPPPTSSSSSTLSTSSLRSLSPRSHKVVQLCAAAAKKTTKHAPHHRVSPPHSVCVRTFAWLHRRTCVYVRLLHLFSAVVQLTARTHIHTHAHTFTHVTCSLSHRRANDSRK